MKAENGTAALRGMADRAPRPFAIAALTAALALSTAPAWADGGNGAPAGAGQGGVDGALAGATGQNAANGATAGGGGGGVDLTTGNGAPGGSGGTGLTFNAPNGAPGATGATGQVISTSGTISTSVSGGTGAPGPDGVNGTLRGGGGGGGGGGVSATADIVVTGSGSVKGGAGGIAGSFSNGGGGGGGVGVFSSADVTVDAGGSVTGGVGGRGTTQSGGGGGAAAIVLTGSGTVRNSGNLLGGTGGRTISVAGGGDGGAGILLLSGGTVINGTGATIVGGTGGQAGATGTAGDGGAGIKGANMAVINAGTISGGAVGAGGGGPTAGKAIQFTGGVNSLEIQAGSTITGNVVAFSAADTFKLGGDTSASFDVSQIGPGAKYDGFGFYEKTGNSTWTLTGTTTAVTPWTLSDGILQISSDSNLGADSGGLTFNGGTLETTADTISDRTIALTGDGTFLTDPSTTLTLSNVISGAGGLTKAGDGTLILTADSSYSGVTTISAGTLQLGNGGTTGSITGDVTNNGTLAFDRSNDLTFAGAISGSGALVQQGTGSTTLTGANSYGGGTTISAGTLVGQATSFGSGNILDNAALVFDQPTDATFTAVISGTGTLTKTGAGNLNLTGINTLNGPTTIEAGKLSVNGSLANSAVTILDGGALGGNGTVGSTTLQVGGIIAPGNSIGTLTVQGNFIGAGGTVEIEAMLDGDASSTDKLIITGNTSGTANIKVILLGGAGAQTVDGIKIIDVGGVSAGAFNLQGDYVFQGDQAVVAGAYAYRLYQNGISTPTDGDWYLRSALINPVDPGGPATPLYSPAVPIYEAYAGVLQSFTQLGTLQQRMGNRSWTGAAQSATGESSQGGSPIWGRIEATHSEFEPGTTTTGSDYDADLWRLQAGLDVLLSETASGMLVGGLTVHYGTVKSGVSSSFGTGSIDTNGYGFGGTLTWYGKNGFYVDTQAELTWFDSDLSSATLGRTLAKSNDGFGYGLGIEAGQKIALQGNWSLTPQAQLSYASVDFDSFTDPYGAVVSNGSSDSLIGRLGLSADYESEWKDKASRTSHSHVYGIGNLYYDFLDGTGIDVSGTELTSKPQQLWGGLGVGGSLSWADDRYAVHGELLARTSLEDFGDSHSFGGSVGFSVKW